ncbi:predicted protein [Lichtheimia corymbifera JMRC:FSU:9682]|uniref:Heterokaryon incompatibility domain-containing protein n=1 Tax=Lichtheimia corymbifera JMRC:FSU:9682 TaxID=1263082 RepID=A0A068S7C1_9FUNG|nr:predicted protein [Lichtheimia corymbifera JMRC:FSU:9682]
MTCDTDEDDSSIKINDGGPWKQFFEEGLGALLADKHFLLLYVPKDGAKMRIIRPATDPYHRQRMIKRVKEAKSIPSFYYALSHLWGISKDNPHFWEEIGDYVDDTDGQPASPVSMRSEKRATLLALLKAHPDSYWWIDVLCARTDTPLDIMGDIYSCCLECVAMIDCEPSLLPKFHTEKNTREKLYDYDMYKRPSPEFLVRGKHLYAKYPQLVAQVYHLQQSAWWKRVWTWQEMALPYGVVRLIAETDDHHFQTNTTTMDDLINSFKNLFDVYYYLKATSDDEDRQHIAEKIKFMIEIYNARTFSKHRFRKKSPARLGSLLSSLSYSSRRCMDPVDYVYGVLGMLQLKIPRMNDPIAVWQRLMSELEKYIEAMEDNQIEVNGVHCIVTGFDDRAYLVDLREAVDMSDVYDKLKFVESVIVIENE